MDNITNVATKKEEPVAVPDHTQQIKSQVLAKIGRPFRLDHVEVSQHHGRKYRVNIWQRPESDKTIALMIAPRIGRSFYLTVSDTGEILDRNPPLIQLGFSD